MTFFSQSTPWLRRVIFATFLGIVFLSPAFPAAAQGNSAIAQQFQTKDDGVTTASLVSAGKGNDSTIERSSINHPDRLVGVVASDPLIALSDGGTGVQVVISGLTLALVSDIGGAVATGDKITISPIEGVGMKATDRTTIVGTAQADLKTDQAETRTVTDKSGRKVTIRIGLVPVQIGVAFFAPESDKPTAFVPSFLQEIANNLSGRDVSPIRVLVAALILLLLFVSVTVLLYSAVRSSIISIGRNPLSEAAVRKSLIQVLLTALGILLFAAGLIYIVLTF